MKTDTVGTPKGIRTKALHIGGVSKRIFLVEFRDYKKEKEWRDCFLAVNETDVSQKIKVKYKDGFTSYQIVDSYDC